MQVVAMDDQIAGILADGFIRLRQQRPERHVKMMVVNVFLTFKVQFRHCLIPVGLAIAVVLFLFHDEP